MFRAFVTAYPWDLPSEDLESRLDHLQGEVGATGVSLWVAAPPVIQVRGRDAAPRTTRSRGGLLFHPDESLYAATRVKPIASSWVKSKQPIERLASDCKERGLAVRVKVSAALTGRLAEKHPDAACKNLYGDASRTSLCLFNPDVESFLASLLADLVKNHPVTSITLADFFAGWAEAADRRLGVCVPDHAAVRQVLALCFCESCLQRSKAGGVDASAARHSAGEIVQGALEGVASPDRSSSPAPSARPLLSEFQRWRFGELEALLDRLAGGCEVDLLLDRAADDLGWTLPGICVPDKVVAVTAASGLNELGGALCPEARWNEVRLPAAAVAGRHGPEAVQLVSRAVELGFQGVDFDDYGLLPESAFATMKQAIRIGRRSAGG